MKRGDLVTIKKHFAGFVLYKRNGLNNSFLDIEVDEHDLLLVLESNGHETKVLHPAGIVGGVDSEDLCETR